jgi:hypothetical protein
MHRSRKLALLVFSCAAIVMAILVTAMLTVHFMAERELVKSYIVQKVDQVTGGELDYDRLVVRFFPVPHIAARDIYLVRTQRFRLAARKFSVYPRILPMLKGQVSIRRLVLTNPEIVLQMNSSPGSPPDLAEDKRNGCSAESVKAILQGVFNALKAIDPQSEVKIEQGNVMLRLNEKEAFHVSRMTTLIEREKEHLSLSGYCSSNLAENFRLKATANLTTLQARGKLAGMNVNIRPLVHLISLPDDIRTAETRAQGSIVFTVNGPENVHGRFDIAFPSVKAMRKDRHLDLDDLELSGVANLSPKGFSFDLTRVHSAKPALDFAAAATLSFQGHETNPVVELHAETAHLDLAVAGSIVRDIAGDLDAIKTAFTIAEQGILTDVRFFAAFAVSENEFHCVKKKASGSLTRGKIVIPGVWTEIEALDGGVVYEDCHVVFKQVRGYFNGAEFQKLNAMIDWQTKPEISIESPSAEVDLAKLFEWLSSFDVLAKVKKYVDSVSGTGIVSSLNIDGPLLEPSRWSYKAFASPRNVSIASPLIPFDVSLNGGEIVYVPGKEQASGVTVEFLDGSFLASYQARGKLDVESTFWRIDGTMGKKVLDWIGTISPIPKHLQIKPPVRLSNIIVVTNSNPRFSFTGNIETAGGVDLFADLTFSPGSWQLRKFQFSDGHSKATIAMTKVNRIFDVSFSGNIEKLTADRLLHQNNTILDYLKGDFHALIDPHAPLASSFTGKLEGKEVRLRQVPGGPITINKLALEGNGSRLTVFPSQVSFLGKAFSVQGFFSGKPKYMKVDLDVATDTLDETFFSALQAVGKTESQTGSGKRLIDEILLEGAIHLNAGEISYGGFTWIPVDADINITDDALLVTINKANLCGISTTGELTFSPDGFRFDIYPVARDVSLQESTDCLGHLIFAVEANYDLSGEIRLPRTEELSERFLTGEIDFLSKNGKVYYSNVMMKMLALLNFTEALDGGKEKPGKEGIGFSKASFKAELGQGKIELKEMLFDGDSLKLTGQGNVDVKTKKVDIVFLVAPLTAIDRIVKKIPIVGYITGGSLFSVPFRVKGPIDNPSVIPIPPGAVGKGLVGLMERTLKAPFVLVEQAADLVTEND